MGAQGAVCRWKEDPIHTEKKEGCNTHRVRMADRVPQDAHLQLSNAAEIVGKVLPDLSVKVFQATDFGSNIGTIISQSL